MCAEDLEIYNCICELSDDVFNCIYGDEYNNGVCSDLCDSCKNEGCKMYDYAGEFADVMERDGYGNYYVVKCPCFTNKSIDRLK